MQLRGRLPTRPQAEVHPPRPSLDRPLKTVSQCGRGKEGAAARLGGGGLRTEWAAHRRKDTRGRQTRGRREVQRREGGHLPTPDLRTASCQPSPGRAGCRALHTWGHCGCTPKSPSPGSLLENTPLGAERGGGGGGADPRLPFSVLPHGSRSGCQLRTQPQAKRPISATSFDPCNSPHYGRGSWSPGRGGRSPLGGSGVPAVGSVGRAPPLSLGDRGAETQAGFPQVPWLQVISVPLWAHLAGRRHLPSGALCLRFTAAPQ